VSVAGGRTAVEAGPRPTILSWRRLLVCLGGGLLAAGLATVAGVPEIAVLVGWSVAAGGLLVWVGRIGWPRDPEGTKRLAEEEGRTRVTDTVVLVAAVLSLAAVAEALVRSRTQDAVSVATVVLGGGAVVTVVGGPVVEVVEGEVVGGVVGSVGRGTTWAGPADRALTPASGKTW